MLFIRMGPRLLFVQSSQVEGTKDFLMEELAGEETDFYTGMEEATENNCLIFITDVVDHDKTIVEDAKSIIMVKKPALLCLSTIINNYAPSLVKRVNLGPSIMFMRIAGNEEKIVEHIRSMYNGKVLSLKEAVSAGEMYDTILSLTKKQLSHRLSLKDVLDTYLLLPQPASQIYRKLRSEGILFITRNLEERRWYELRLNIYDAYGRYREQYERLIFVLSQLEVGMVLEESWTRDHALALLSVLAYQIRLFTLYEPEEIKKILLGLEYDGSGKRLADFDLYYRNHKISWVDINRDRKDRNKIEEAMQYRQKILSELTPMAAEKFLEMEREIREKKCGSEG